MVAICVSAVVNSTDLTPDEIAAIVAGAPLDQLNTSTATM